MKRGWLPGILLPALVAVAGVHGQELDGDAWYYERIAVQDRPLTGVETVPESWQDSWNPLVRRLRREIGDCLEQERRLPRLRFELQGDRSNKFALFRCVEGGSGYSLTIAWEEPVVLDDVFLLPTRIPQADGTIRMLGFPVQSRIEIAESGMALPGGAWKEEGEVRSFPVPFEVPRELQGFPVRVPLDGKPARALRWVIEEPYAPFKIGYLAVSEMFVLSGNQNVAPRGQVRWSDSFLPDRSMTPAFLKDEKTPLGLPLIREETSVLGYHSEIKELTEIDEEWIELRWEEPRKIASIRLIPAQQRVLPHTETFGFPLAHRTDFFRGERKLGSRSVRYAIDPGQNVVTVPGFPGEAVDRVRWVATELWQRRNSGLLALAEIEALGPDDRNLAGDATLHVSSDGVQNRIWNRESLTDGLASEGRIISAGEWLRGLHQSREWRLKRMDFTAALEEAIRRTNRLVLVALLILPVPILLGAALLGRKVRKRAESESLEFRKQLASDLHDDLGGNLGSIVLLADQVREKQEENSDASRDLSRVVELARDSRNQLRTILKVSESDPNHALDVDGFVSRLRLTIRDFFGDEHGYFTVPDDGGKTIGQLSGKQRGEVLLFCKEALHNLTQHSDATRVLVQLGSSDGGVILTLEDNSTVPLSENGELISKSLQSRAGRIGEQVVVERLSGGGGNTIQLHIPYRPK